MHVLSTRYIDLATRLVVVDLSAYNPMMDMWVGARAFIELPKSGGVVVSYQLTPVRLYSWTESDILSNILLEVVIAVFYAYVAVCIGVQRIPYSVSRTVVCCAT